MRGPAHLTFGLVFGLVFMTAAPTSSAAQGVGEQPRERTVWGTVVAAGDESLTVQPKPPTRRPSRRAQRRAPGTNPAATNPAATKLAAPNPEQPPAQQVIPVAKDQTEVAFAEVQRELPMADGTTLRTFIDPVPAALADLKPGLSVQVNVRDGVATRVLIAWGEYGTLMRVEADSITYRRIPPPDGAKEDAAREQTVTISADMTSVRSEVIVEEGPVPGRGFRRAYEYKPGTLADLNVGDAVIVCAKDGAAAKITVLPPPKARAE